MACDVLAKTVSTVVIPSQRFGWVTSKLEHVIEGFSFGLLSKGPEECADGDHDHIFVIIITVISITIIGFGAQGKSEFSGTVSHLKVQTLSNRTPN